MTLLLIILIVYISVIVLDLIPLFKKKNYKPLAISVFLLSSSFVIEMLVNENIYKGSIAFVLTKCIDFLKNK